jgi:hypothetical protein
MKRILLLTLLLASITLSSQTKILDKIAKETCEYLQKDEIKKLSGQEKTMKLGVFILTMYSKYQKKLKKEGISLDLSKGEEGGREFGEKVGLAMVQFCPDVLMAFAAEGDGDDDVDIEGVIEELPESSTYKVEGTIVGVHGEEFSSVTITDVNGKTQKFVWISNFKGSDKLIIGNNIEGLKVEVSYKNIECYSPQLKEYISRKQITEIKYL